MTKQAIVNFCQNQSWFHGIGRNAHGLKLLIEPGQVEQAKSYLRSCGIETSTLQFEERQIAVVRW
jgi:hypothetical protein